MKPAANRTKLKRCASAPPEREAPSKKLLDERNTIVLIKAEACYPTPSPFATPTPTPRKMASIRGVKPLYARQQGNILVYLTPGVTYMVDYMSFKKSGWLYDRMKEKLEDTQDDRLDIDLLSDALDPESLFPIEYFFILPPSNHKLRRVTRTELLPYLSARSSSTPIIKTEPDEEDSPLTTREASISFQQPDANPQLVQAYELLLNLMHGLPLPTFNNQAFPLTLDAVKKLIELCSQNFYDIAFLLSPAINKYLHDEGRNLFLAIKTDPPRMAIVATRLRDKSIMTEAFIHIIGAYHKGHWPWKTSKERLSKGNKSKRIMDTVRMKAEGLEIACSRADRRLFLNSILAETEDGEQSRVSIESNKESWTAVQIFRDWLTKELDRADEDPIARGAVYRKLYRGGDSEQSTYRVGEMMKQLGVGFDPEELEEDMIVMWSFAKEAVAGLCQNNLMLDVEANGIQYLTCAEVCKEDMPWDGLERELIELDSD
jgi:hypothetical protein